jgi:predicted nucleic acid-binding protein
MNGIDTNVLIYSLDKHEPVKQAKAQTLIRRLGVPTSTPTALLWQVAGELVSHLRRWQDQGKITRADLVRELLAFRSTFPLVMPTPAVLDRALDLTARYSLSHWDSMLLGACIEAGVTTLYTEDMGSPTTFDSVQLVNPFT